MGSGSQWRSQFDLITTNIGRAPPLGNALNTVRKPPRITCGRVMADQPQHGGMQLRSSDLFRQAGVTALARQSIGWVGETARLIFGSPSAILRAAQPFAA